VIEVATFSYSNAGVHRGGGAVPGRAPFFALGSSIDTDVLVLAFAISVIGGLGSIVGSGVGALIVGMVVSFGLVIPATNPFALAFVFIIMTAVLIVRPRGLFGRPEL